MESACVSNGLLNPIPVSSVVFTENILLPLHNSYLYEESKDSFIYNNAYLINNAALERRYHSFRAEKRKQGYSEEELEEHFGFLLLEDEGKVNELCERGVVVGHSKCSTLGDPTKGVYISVYSDCVDLKRWYNGKTGRIAIIKLTKGKQRRVMENYTQNVTAPSVDFDCHVSEQLSAVSANTSYSLAFGRTQCYLFELQKGNGVEQCPRHVNPFAIVGYSYGKTATTASPLQGKSQQKTVQPWTGQLEIDTVIYSIGLKSIHRAMLPAKLPKKVRADHVIGVSELKQSLPQPVFETCHDYQVLDGKCFSLYEVHPVELEDVKLPVLTQQLKEKDQALIIRLNNCGFLVLLHSSCFLSCEDKTMGLRGIFIFPDTSFIQKVSADIKSGWAKSLLAPEVLQVLPALNYAEMKAAKCPPSQPEALCSILEKHVQNYASQTHSGIPCGPIGEASSSEDQHEVPESFALLTAPKWTQETAQHLKSYFEQPNAFLVPVKRAAELLAAERDQRGQDRDVDVYRCLSSSEQAPCTPAETQEAELSGQTDNTVDNPSPLDMTKEVNRQLVPQEMDVVMQEHLQAGLEGSGTDDGKSITQTDGQAEWTDSSSMPRSLPEKENVRITDTDNGLSLSLSVAVNDARYLYLQKSPEHDQPRKILRRSFRKSRRKGKKHKIVLHKGEQKELCLSTNMTTDDPQTKTDITPIDNDGSSLKKVSGNTLTLGINESKQNDEVSQKESSLQSSEIPSSTPMDEKVVLCPSPTQTEVKPVFKKDWRSFPRKKKHWTSDRSERRVLRSDVDKSTEFRMGKNLTIPDGCSPEEHIAKAPKRKMDRSSYRDKYGLKTIITDCGNVFVPHGSKLSNEKEMSRGSHVPSSSDKGFKEKSYAISVVHTESAGIRLSLKAKPDKREKQHAKPMTRERKSFAGKGNSAPSVEDTKSIESAGCDGCPIGASVKHLAQEPADNVNPLMLAGETVLTNSSEATSSQSVDMDTTYEALLPQFISKECSPKENKDEYHPVMDLSLVGDSKMSLSGKSKENAYESSSTSELTTEGRTEQDFDKQQSNGAMDSKQESNVLSSQNENKSLYESRSLIHRIFHLTAKPNGGAKVELQLGKDLSGRHLSPKHACAEPNEDIMTSAKLVKSSPAIKVKSQREPNKTPAENECISADSAPACEVIQGNESSQIKSTANTDGFGSICVASSGNTCSRDEHVTGACLSSDPLSILADLALSSNNDKRFQSTIESEHGHSHGAQPRLKGGLSAQSISMILLRSPLPESLVVTGALVSLNTKEHSYSKRPALTSRFPCAQMQIAPSECSDTSPDVKHGSTTYKGNNYMTPQDHSTAVFHQEKGNSDGLKHSPALNMPLTISEMTVLKSNLCSIRQISDKPGLIQVTKIWEENYDFTFDSKLTNDPKDKTVSRALHGQWNFNIEDTREQILLIYHMWIGLFYSKPTDRFLDLDPNNPPLGGRTSINALKEKGLTQANTPLPNVLESISEHNTPSGAEPVVLPSGNENGNRVDFAVDNSDMRSSSGTGCTPGNEPLFKEYRSQQSTTLGLKEQRADVNTSDENTEGENDCITPSNDYRKSGPESDVFGRCSYTKPMENNSKYIMLCEQTSNMCISNNFLEMQRVSHKGVHKAVTSAQEEGICFGLHLTSGMPRKPLPVSVNSDENTADEDLCTIHTDGNEIKVVLNGDEKRHTAVVAQICGNSQEDTSPKAEIKIDESEDQLSVAVHDVGISNGEDEISTEMLDDSDGIKKEQLTTLQICPTICVHTEGPVGGDLQTEVSHCDENTKDANFKVLDLTKSVLGVQKQEGGNSGNWTRVDKYDGKASKCGPFTAHQIECDSSITSMVPLNKSTLGECMPLHMSDYTDAANTGNGKEVPFCASDFNSSNKLSKDASLKSCTIESLKTSRECSLDCTVTSKSTTEPSETCHRMASEICLDLTEQDVCDPLSLQNQRVSHKGDSNRPEKAKVNEGHKVPSNAVPNNEALIVDNTNVQIDTAIMVDDNNRDSVPRRDELLLMNRNLRLPDEFKSEPCSDVYSNASSDVSANSNDGLHQSSFHEKSDVYVLDLSTAPLSREPLASVKTSSSTGMDADVSNFKEDGQSSPEESCLYDEDTEDVGEPIFIDPSRNRAALQIEFKEGQMTRSVKKRKSKVVDHTGYEVGFGVQSESNEESDPQGYSAAHRKNAFRDAQCRGLDWDELNLSDVSDNSIRRTVSVESTSSARRRRQAFDWHRYFERESPNYSWVDMRERGDFSSLRSENIARCSTSANIKPSTSTHRKVQKSWFADDEADMTRSSMDYEYLIFSEKMSHILKCNKTFSSTKPQQWGNMGRNPIIVNFSGLSEQDSPDNLYMTLPPLAKLQMKVDLCERRTNIGTEDRSYLPLRLHRDFYDSSDEVAHSKISAITNEYVSLHKVMMDGVCASKTQPFQAGRVRMKPAVTNPVMYKKAEFYDQMKMDMFDCLRDSLNSVVRQSCKTQYRFYIQETSDETFFKEAKTILETEGHIRVEPDLFEVDGNNSSPLLIILRNQDISEHICKIPHLLQLKKSSNVLFAGIDRPDDIVNLTHQEIFANGGFLVFDGRAMDTLTLDNMKKIVSFLEELRRKGRWKWFLHYKDSRRLRENSWSSTELLKKNFMDWCQEAGILEILPYHDCDVMSRDQPDYLLCLGHLQVQNAAARFPVFVTDTPTDSFAASGILTMNMNTLSRILRNDTCCVS